MGAKEDKARLRLEAVAYHEAGHAVVSIRHRRAFRLVTIVPTLEHNTLGHVWYRPRPKWMRPDLDDSPRIARWIENEVLVCLAGPAAERRFTGRSNDVGAGSDHRHAVDLALRLHEDEAVLAKYMAYMLEWARAYVEATPVWEDVEALAAALMERKTLTGTEAKAAVQAALTARMEAEPLPSIAW